MNTGMPLPTSPMTTTFIISDGLSAADRRMRFSPALANTTRMKGRPTPIGKKDHVISVDPTMKTDRGAPRQTISTIPIPSRIERIVKPPRWRDSLTSDTTEPAF